MSQVTYDVCVIGSGAAGGVMAKELCEGGASLRGEKQEPFYPSDLNNTIRYETRDQVSVDRIRVLGGRTLHWNAVVLRYSRADFRERSTERN